MGELKADLTPANNQASNVIVLRGPSDEVIEDMHDVRKRER
jgi:hypothetical protein